MISKILKLLKSKKNKNFRKNMMKENCGVYSEEDLKELRRQVEWLIKNNTNYFILEIQRTTREHFFEFLKDPLYKDWVKSLGYSHSVGVNMFSKYGIFFYTTDLYSYVDAPKCVKYYLEKLVLDYGLENVSEAISICLKQNYAEKFAIETVKKQ